MNVGDNDNPEYKYDVLAGFVDLSEYAKTSDVQAKDTDAVSGNLAMFDENGNTVDSSKKASDFAAADHSHSNAVASENGEGGSAGFMSASDKEKLDGVHEGATKVEAGSAAGKIKVNGADVTVVEIASDTEVQDMLEEVFADTTNNGGGE